MLFLYCGCHGVSATNTGNESPKEPKKSPYGAQKKNNDSTFKLGEKKQDVALRKFSLATKKNTNNLNGIAPSFSKRGEVHINKIIPTHSQANHSYFKTLPNSNWVAEQEIVSNKKTSTVLVVIDALNAKHIGAYGYKRNTTPNMDQLAKESVVFTDWVSNSSWTRPSFTTLLTGVPKSIHQMELSDKKLAKNMETVAEKFKQKGYQTAAFIGNPLIQSKWRFDQGFDHFEDVAIHGNFPRAQTLVASALSWMKNNVSTKPVFIVMFLTDTHAPYEAPKGSQKFSDGLSNIIRSPEREVRVGLDKSQLAKIVAAYDDELFYVDEQVGELIGGLKKLGMYSTTTLAITADHGEIFGEHNCFQHAYHMWEPVLRVPFLVRSPNIPKTGYSDRMATHTDVLPTLLHINGFSSETKYGKSVFAGTQKNKSPIVSEYDARGVVRRAARIGSVKIIRYEKVHRAQFEGVGKTKSILEKNPSLLIPGPRYELFDLENDPNENNNLYNKLSNGKISIPNFSTDDLDVLKKAACAKGKKRNENNGQKVISIDNETLNALKAAGYIQ